MKKKVIISIAIILILILGQGVVKAASPSATLSGDSKGKAGQTGTITLNVTSGDSKAGVVSGKIIIDDKIESIKDTEVKGVNGWNPTYNPATGDFNAVKAAGASSDTEACITITYTIKSGATGVATIETSDLKVTDLQYITTTVANVSKDITIEEAQTPVVPDPGTNGGNNGGTTGGTTTSGSNNASNKNTSTTAKTKMPQTGDNTMVILVAGTMIAVIGTVAFIQYKRTY